MPTTPTILIVFGSSYGQTAKIAERIRGRLESEGVAVTLVRGDRIPTHLDPARFDAIVVGASVVLSGHQRYVARFVERHLDVLARIPSAFFSVSGSAGSKRAEGQADATRLKDAFLEKVGWHPEVSATFAGAIAYTRYNPFIRWVMKRISAKEGGSTDTSRDHEYTDWDQVEAFARSVAAALPSPRHRPGVSLSI